MATVGFEKLLEIQSNTLGNVETIRTLMEKAIIADPSSIEIEQTEILDSIKDSQQQMTKITNDALKVQKQTLTITREDAERSANTISELAKAIGAQKTPVEKLVDFKNSLVDSIKKLSPKNILESATTGLLKKLNIGGIFNRKLQQREFITQQKQLGSTRSDAELREDFKQRLQIAKQLSATERAISELSAKTGLSEEQLRNTDSGRKLIEQKTGLTQEFLGTDIAARAMAGIENANQPVRIETAEGDSETAIETQRMAEENKDIQTDQSTTLKSIDDTLKSGLDKANQAGKGGSFLSSLFGGIGAAIGGMGKAIGGIMGGIGKGFAGLLTGIAKGLMALANPASLLGLGAFTLAVIGIGKGMEMAAPGIAALAPILMKVAETIGGVFMEAIKAIPEIIMRVGGVITGVIDSVSGLITGVIDKIVESVERLGQVDGSNLLSVGAGLLAVSAGLAAFGASNAIAGVGNLVSNLLTIGQDNPIEQLEKISKFGVNLEKAGIGVEKLGKGLSVFNNVDADKIKAISALPVEKIAAMGAAMQTPVVPIAAQSAINEELRLNQMGGGSTAVVNAPVQSTTNNIKNSVVKLPTRNQDSSYSSYVSRTYVSQ